MPALPRRRVSEPRAGYTSPHVECLPPRFLLLRRILRVVNRYRLTALDPASAEILRAGFSAAGVPSPARISVPRLLTSNPVADAVANDAAPEITLEISGFAAIPMTGEV